MTFRPFAAAAVLMPLAFVGCGHSPYDVAPTRGVVTLDGEPLSGGKIMLSPVAEAGSLKAGKSALARIDEDGSFVATTYSRDDGAVVADHSVTIINTDPKSPSGRRLRVKRVPLPDRVTIVAGRDNLLDVAFTTETVAKHGTNY